MGDWIAGSHDIKQGSHYLHNEGQLTTESSEHKMWPSFGATDRGERAKKGRVHLNFIFFDEDTYIGLIGYDTVQSAT
jgi:hypothetical protein